VYIQLKNILIQKYGKLARAVYLPGSKQIRFKLSDVPELKPVFFIEISLEIDELLKMLANFSGVGTPFLV
jgi:hypothetical protein